MPEPTIPVVDIYETVNGQGPRTGEPITLVRVTIPKWAKYAWIEPIRKDVRYTEMTLSEFLERLRRLGHKWVFIGGEDPCILELGWIALAMRRAGFRSWIDCTGIYQIPPMVDYVSIGPKPGLPYGDLRRANDVRLYYSPEEPFWGENIDRVLEDPNLLPGKPVYIAPRSMDQASLNAVIRLVLEINRPDVRADFPLYRVLPTFDSEFNRGKLDPICTTLDRLGEQK